MSSKKIQDIVERCVNILQESNNNILLNNQENVEIPAYIVLDCLNLIKFLMYKESQIKDLELENCALINENCFLDDKICIATEILEETKDNENMSDYSIIEDYSIRVNSALKVLKNESYYEESDEEENEDYIDENY